MGAVNFLFILTLTFIAQGCDDSDMCDDSGPCAENGDMCNDSGPCAENGINYSTSHSGAYPCAITPICAILNKSNTHDTGTVNAHPCAITPICAIEAKLLLASEERDSDLELLEDDSDVELLEEAGGGNEAEEVDDKL